jgi:hypothetical protein
MHPFIVAGRPGRRPKRRLVLTKLTLVRFPPGHHYGSTEITDSAKHGAKTLNESGRELLCKID